MKLRNAVEYTPAKISGTLNRYFARYLGIKSLKKSICLSEWILLVVELENGLDLRNTNDTILVYTPMISRKKVLFLNR